ncbi:MAG: translation initiation factor IF-2 [Candidatus Dadabacteria bacterium]|nr:MAG: translation initiation factor IF-2 [Candidatus Dadabacteria bacterium]
MAKIRIYELAKELGVENKVVLEQAAQLGIPGKTSHSNSLEQEEADRIRREIIRNAIGSSPDSERIRTRVERSTGETDTVVERRKGNIIRRRKRKEPAPEPEVEKPLEVKEEQPEVEAEVAAGESVEEGQEGDQVSALKKEQEVSESPEQEAETQEAIEEEPKEEQEKKGPKVLGRIELPVRKKAKPSRKPKDEYDAAQIEEELFEEDDEEEGDGKRKKRKDRKKRRKRAISGVDLVDYDGRSARRAARGKTRGKDQQQQEEEQAHTEITTPKASKRIVRMDEAITVGDLARQMSLKASEVIQKLIELGVMATINQVIDFDTASIVAEEFGFQVESTSFDESEVLAVDEDQGEALPRPPVVTVMGHVDHGKTSLLDYIRNSSVAAKEAGGITQHIGAYSVKVGENRRVTFVDTPGHAAFTAMRARGAQVTDIVVLVVAADDGVMPQTVEAINHAKAADVPIIVAINKIDKPEAKPDKIKQQLSEHGLQPEEWGGDTLFFHVSALTGEGIQDLLEGIALVAEIKELKAVVEGKARGVVIEARQERGRGTVATVLVQRGTLKVGDIFVTGCQHGRVRSMFDHTGTPLEEATPSIPVEISGLTGVPTAGDDFVVVESEAVARQVASKRAEKIAQKEALKASQPITLEEFARRASEEAAQELHLVIKADVQGSIEAVKEAVEKLSTEKVRVKIIHSAVGGINESDIKLAAASNAIVVGFNVRAEVRAAADAEASGVELRFYKVIYELVDDIKKAMEGLLPPIRQEKPLGRVEVRDTFSVPKIGKVAGCYVSDGVVKRGAMLRLLRDNVVVYEGKMMSLKRFKDDVKEVQSGYECGIAIDGYNDIKVGDVMEVFEIEEIAQKLDQ